MDKNGNVSNEWHGKTMKELTFSGVSFRKHVPNESNQRWQNSFEIFGLKSSLGTKW